MAVAVAPVNTGPRTHLRYPSASVVVLAGMPGVGKTTLLKRLYPAGSAEPRIIDSDDVRRRIAEALPWLPYPLYRPLVHFVHYLRIRHAVTRRDQRPVIVHDTGSHRALRHWMARLAVRSRREAHLLLLDVPPEEARAGQQRRKRQLSQRRFDKHVAGSRAVLDAAAADPGSLGDYSTVTVLDRRTADALRAIVFAAEH